MFFLACVFLDLGVKILKMSAFIHRLGIKAITKNRDLVPDTVKILGRNNSYSFLPLGSILFMALLEWVMPLQFVYRNKMPDLFLIYLKLVYAQFL